MFDHRGLIGKLRGFVLWKGFVYKQYHIILPNRLIECHERLKFDMQHYATLCNVCNTMQRYVIPSNLNVRFLL